MHYTGTIWRPPYEASSLLLEVTAGCTHHKCKFCTLYEELPFGFKMTPMEIIEADIKEAAAVLGRRKTEVKRVFLTGANPFVLKFDRLIEIGELIHKHFGESVTIGCFSRITDIAFKSGEELEALKRAGYDGLTIGVETGDGKALDFMIKGYKPEDIVTQCKRLDKAGIDYYFFYLVGISGKGRGEEGARLSADVFNKTNPKLVGVNMLTIYPNSALYGEIVRGNWKEESELEKYREIRTLAENLKIDTIFAALGASNAFQMYGRLPQDREQLLADIDSIISGYDEKSLRSYRENLPHL